MQGTEYARSIPALEELMRGADHVDAKTVESSRTMREFLAAMLSWMPWWVRWLYGIRGVVARLFGLEQPESEKKGLTPEEVPLRVGEKAAIFTVTGAEDGKWWASEASDKHLAAWVVVAVEPLAAERKLFHVLTVVKYRHWTGPVYFNLIRPFHHLIVHCMARHSA